MLNLLQFLVELIINKIFTFGQLVREGARVCLHTIYTPVVVFISISFLFHRRWILVSL